MGCKNCKEKRKEMTPDRQESIIKKIWVWASIITVLAAYGFYTLLIQLWALIT